jgi:hypothetical protein
VVGGCNLPSEWGVECSLHSRALTPPARRSTTRCAWHPAPKCSLVDVANGSMSSSGARPTEGAVVGQLQSAEGRWVWTRNSSHLWISCSERMASASSALGNL